ncbi:MAG: ribosome-associated translation inhibitor RaiA [Chloroflexota bacterium]
MRTIVTGRNLDIPDDDRDYVVRKMGRLERLLDDRTDASVELSRAAHRAQDETAIVEVTLLVDGRPVRAVARAATHRAATDQVVDRLGRQVVELKERRSRPGASVGGRVGPASTAPGSADWPEPRIVKVKRFAIEPMFEEDAVARMEELGHDFFVFVNAESEPDRGAVPPTRRRLRAHQAYKPGDRCSSRAAGRPTTAARRTWVGRPVRRRSATVDAIGPRQVAAVEQAAGAAASRWRSARRMSRSRSG